MMLAVELTSTGSGIGPVASRQRPRCSLLRMRRREQLSRHPSNVRAAIGWSPTAAEACGHQPLVVAGMKVRLDRREELEGGPPRQHHAHGHDVRAGTKTRAVRWRHRRAVSSSGSRRAARSASGHFTKCDWHRRHGLPVDTRLGMCARCASGMFSGSSTENDRARDDEQRHHPEDLAQYARHEQQRAERGQHRERHRLHDLVHVLDRARRAWPCSSWCR